MDRREIRAYMLVGVLILAFITLGVKSYHIGFYNGMDEMCDMDIGINENYEFVCYDKQEQQLNINQQLESNKVLLDIDYKNLDMGDYE